MHDGGAGGFGGGDSGGHHGGHGGSVGHHTPEHHSQHSQHGADGQFMAWADPTAGDDASRLRRRGRGPGGSPVNTWLILAVVAILVVIIFAAH